MGWQDRIASWGRHRVKSDHVETEPSAPEAEPRLPHEPNRAVVDNAVYCEGERLEPPVSGRIQT